MKVELDNVTLGVSPLTETVFAGVSVPLAKGKPGQMVWKHKKDVTNEFISCVIEKWKGFKERILSSDGSIYEISVKQITPGNAAAKKKKQKHG